MGCQALPSLLLALLLLLGPVVPLRSAFAAETTIGRIAVTNVDDKSFAISWVTDQPADGYVRYGLDPNAVNNTWTRVEDVRGPSYTGYTHYISVENGDPGRVDPSTTYYYTVTSTRTTVAITAGVPQMVRTSETLPDQPPPPNFFSGIVRYVDGSPAAGTLAFVTLQRVVSGQPTVTSQQLSGLTDRSGAFSIDVSHARVARGQVTGDYFRLSTTSADEKIIYELDAGQGNRISGTADGNTTSAGSAAPVQPRVFTLQMPPGPVPTASPTSALVVTPPPPLAPALSPSPTTARPSPSSTPTRPATPTPPAPTPAAPSPTQSPVDASSPTATSDATPTVAPTPTPPRSAAADAGRVPPGILAVIGVAVLLITTGLALTAIGLLEASRRR